MFLFSPELPPDFKNPVVNPVEIKKNSILKKAPHVSYFTGFTTGFLKSGGNKKNSILKKAPYFFYSTDFNTG